MIKYIPIPTYLSFSQNVFLFFLIQITISSCRARARHKVICVSPGHHFPSTDIDP